MLENIYNQTITILNKQKSTGREADKWYKHVVQDAAWYQKSTRSANANGVWIGSFTKVLIPYHQEYVPYRHWKLLEDKTNTFTMNSGDYIVLGELTDEVTPENIIKLVDDLKPSVCKVQHVNMPHMRFNSYVQLYVEGV